ncbi:unnamed protein product [Mesocestoides corti]|uniref:Peptidase S54 rhomboid domain-containing protein n=1 Tax=Mesocestoides corti TaxID=53468 RepID=A0A158QS58_MESCO|nr:unnamed protein product [Mesocestoides corti]
MKHQGPIRQQDHNSGVACCMSAAFGNPEDSEYVRLLGPSEHQLGSLAHSVSDPFVALAGASGGCYALIGAHVATIIMNWKTMQAGWLKSPVNFLSTGADTGFAIYERFTNPNSAKIGFVAHLGGFVAGVLVGIPVLRNLEIERWEKVCFWVCIFLFAAFMAAAVLFNGFCEEYNWCPPTDWNSVKYVDEPSSCETHCRLGTNRGHKATKETISNCNAELSCVTPSKESSTTEQSVVCNQAALCVRGMYAVELHVNQFIVLIQDGTLEVLSAKAKTYRGECIINNNI